MGERDRDRETYTERQRDTQRDRVCQYAHKCMRTYPFVAVCVSVSKCNNELECVVEYVQRFQCELLDV